MALQFDMINTATTKVIQPGVVDNFFKAGPVIAMAKSRFTRKWIGPTIQENFLFRPLIGGVYAKGGAFNLIAADQDGHDLQPALLSGSPSLIPGRSPAEMAGPTSFSDHQRRTGEAALTMSAASRDRVLPGTAQNLVVGTTAR